MVTETAAVGLEQVLAIGGNVQKTGEGINVEDEQPPAKRFKLNSASSSEGTRKDGSEYVCVWRWGWGCVCVCSPGKIYDRAMS